MKALEGVPRFYNVIDGLAIIVEEIPGKNIEGLEKENPLEETFFYDLRQLIEKVHARGLAHCDLKRAPNILIGDNGKPYIVDWSAAVSKSEFRFFPFNTIYRRFLEDDFNAVTKIKLTHIPDEKQRYFYRSKGEKLIRAIRDRLRTLLQKVA